MGDFEFGCFRRNVYEVFFIVVFLTVVILGGLVGRGSEGFFGSFL